MNAYRFEEFQRIQEQLRERVRIEPLTADPELIAAVDTHLGSDGTGIAAAVLVDRSGKCIDQRIVTMPIDVPYVPGYLSFREMPVCREAVLSLSTAPHLILADGQGTAHPRRFGLACHLGVELDTPTIGVAKSRLAGRGHAPGEEKGSTSPLYIGKEIVGMAVRTRTGVKPLYVSPGHLITLDESVEYTLSLCSRYRLPDPSRLAHRIAREAAARHRSS